MQIIIDQREIKEAIVSYIDAQGINLKNKKPEISLTAGRGPNGMTAEINLIDYSEETVDTPESQNTNVTLTKNNTIDEVEENNEVKKCDDIEEQSNSTLFGG